MITYTFGKEDFLDSHKPYEELYQYRKDHFEHERRLIAMTENAKAVGISNFKKLYAGYTKDVHQVQQGYQTGNTTDFTGQPFALETGDWRADDLGITRRVGGQEIQACCHPLMPVERLVNVDTGVEKLKLAFSKGFHWKTVIADKRTLASNTGILALADMGIAVNCENAKYLISYLHDVESLNYDRIPEKKSVNRLGWIDDYGFSPYVKNLIFDGEAAFRPIFENVRAQGSRDDWMKIASEIRHSSLPARIILAASFASALVNPCGCLPFFVHLWGTESGTGKTVALMVAASVWANPEFGKYIQTFNATVVGREKLAAFCNSLPLVIDELQLAKDRFNKQTFDVYILAEGMGRTRSTRAGGVDRTPTWSNCILTSGETPITQPGAGSGALNRVVDVECRSGEMAIRDGQRIASAVRRSFGHAGREFVEKLDRSGLEQAVNLYQMLYRELSASDKTEKQAMAAALILTADHLVTDWIFADDMHLTIEEIRQFLLSREQVSANQRAYDFICDWVRQSRNRFSQDNNGDFYGEIYGGTAYIIPSIFQKTLEDEGFSSAGFLSWLRTKKLIMCEPGRFTIKRTIAGDRIRCIALKMPDTISDFT